MELRLDLVGIVVGDMRASLAFYRRLGLDVAEEAADEPHAEAVTPGGLRVAWDTAELIKQIDASWDQRYAVVKDPDGNPVDLFASL